MAETFESVSSRKPDTVLYIVTSHHQMIASIPNLRGKVALVTGAKYILPIHLSRPLKN
jgi:hypothetical protein